MKNLCDVLQGFPRFLVVGSEVVVPLDHDHRSILQVGHSGKEGISQWFISSSLVSHQCEHISSNVKWSAEVLSKSPGGSLNIWSDPVGSHCCAIAVEPQANHLVRSSELAMFWHEEGVACGERGWKRILCPSLLPLDLFRWWGVNVLICVNIQGNILDCEVY